MSQSLKNLHMDHGALLNERWQNMIDLVNLAKQARLSPKAQKTLDYYCQGWDIKELAAEEKVSERAIFGRITRITANMKIVALKNKRRR